jgi:hypothetical protein
VEAYQAYLNNNDAPKKYAKTAQSRIQVIENGADERAWDKAYQENTVEAYQAYLEGDTLKKQADEAKKQIQVLDEKAWQQACEENTVAAYQAYLNGNTLKQYADDAQKYADKKAWQQACEENTVAAYQTYLEGDTLKKYADESEKRLEDIEAWQWTKAAYQARYQSSLSSLFRWRYTQKHAMQIMPKNCYKAAILIMAMALITDTIELGWYG